MNRTRRSYVRKGFTLIELIAVVVVLAMTLLQVRLGEKRTHYA